MKIIINGAVYSDAPQGGTYRVFNEIIPRLAKFRGVNLKVFAPHTAVEIPGHRDLKIENEPLSTPATRLIPEGALKDKLRRLKWTLRPWWLKLKLGGTKNAVFHSTTYAPSPWKDVPEIVTVHDMISEIFPELHQEPHLIRQRNDKLQSIRHANRLIAISECTKRDLIRLYQIPEEFIDVIPHGVDLEFFQTETNPNEAKTQLKRLNIEVPYLLYVGGRINHKNFERFIQAYACCQRLRELPLVLVGGGLLSQRELALLSQFHLNTHFIHIPKASEAELRLLYQQAKLFVFPSYYEGFGLPLVEAMAAGCPIAAAKTGPFPEIGADAIRYFDPYSISEMASQMESLLNPKIAEECIQKGRRRALQYSWDKSAKLYYESYQRTLKEKRKLKDVVLTLNDPVDPS